MKILNVGCGRHARPEYFGAEWEEVRLDIDPETKPDIVADMVDMGPIGPFGVVYTSHAIEHLYPHDVQKALREFLRVLLPGGFAMVIVPDLEGVKLTDGVLYECPDGPITAMDMIYGHVGTLQNNPHMAHHCGFVGETLKAALLDAGFQSVEIKRFSPYNLMAVAQKESA